MSEQPDLFVVTAADLLQEIHRHGGGIPPRRIADDVPEAVESGRPFSPVRFAERLRRIERETGGVFVREISLERVVRLLL